MTAFLDLFSGIGGFALGAYWAGLRFDAHYFSEVDDYAIRVYQQRFPDAIPLGDITKIDGRTLPDADWIIAGGFPCQDISVAGKGAGLAGERSGLWYEYARIIGELRPRYAIMENVGALTFRGLDAVLGSLASLGYDAEWQDIRASDVGAPHRRERIWIVAYPNARDAERRQGERHRIWGEEVGERSDDNSCRSSAPFVHVADASGERCGKARGLRCDESAQRASSGREALADAQDRGNVRRYGELEPAKGEVREHRGSTQDGSREWWAAEPDVGGNFNGISSWLDGFDMSISHELLLAYGKTEKTGTGEILRILRNQAGEEILRGEAGGFVSLSSQKVLLSYLCKLQENYSDEARLQLEGAEAFEASLRSLWGDDEPYGTSCRSEQREQFIREYTDSLQALSRLLARHAEKAWARYRWKDARSLLVQWLPGWEDGIARTSHNIPARVDRLKCLGNSIVPQIAELIFREIAKY